MEKINIIIPVKKSTRFPGKNGLLAKYTFDWLSKELEEDQYNLFVVGDLSELDNIPQNAKLISTACKSQRDDLLQCMSEAGIYVALQLTQPSRRPGLLLEAVHTFINGNKKLPVISAVYALDISWRELDAQGKWKQKPEGDIRKMYYDGSIYVFDINTVDMIFDRECNHLVVINGGPLIDVDYCTDMPINLTTYNSKQCIIIGSGSDINNRKLGKKIDSGHFGKIFRVNKLYGKREDVGTKTDCAVTLSNVVWQESLEQKKVYIDNVDICIPYVQGDILHNTKMMTGLSTPTTGMQAVCWVLSNGYTPTLIGFGFKNGERFTEFKTYEDGLLDCCESHNFTMENNILKSWHNLGRIKLL